jgi:hypothetical protein
MFTWDPGRCVDYCSARTSRHSSFLQVMTSQPPNDQASASLSPLVSSQNQPARSSARLASLYSNPDGNSPTALEDPSLSLTRGTTKGGVAKVKFMPNASVARTLADAATTAATGTSEEAKQAPKGTTASRPQRGHPKGNAAGQDPRATFIARGIFAQGITITASKSSSSSLSSSAASFTASSSGAQDKLVALRPSSSGESPSRRNLNRGPLQSALSPVEELTLVRIEEAFGRTRLENSTAEAPICISSSHPVDSALDLNELDLTLPPEGEFFLVQLPVLSSDLFSPSSSISKSEPIPLEDLMVRDAGDGHPSLHFTSRNLSLQLMPVQILSPLGTDTFLPVELDHEGQRAHALSTPLTRMYSCSLIGPSWT